MGKQRKGAKAAAANGADLGDLDDLQALSPTVGGPANKKATKVTAAQQLNNNGRTDEELMMMDPKKVRRILANRQSAAKSKERKQQLTSELETRLAAVQEETEKLESVQGALTVDLGTLATYSKSLADEVDELLARVQLLQTSQAVLVKEMLHAQRVLNLQGALPEAPAPPPPDPKPMPALALPRELPPDLLAAPQCHQALKNPLISPRELAMSGLGAPLPPLLSMHESRDGSQNPSAGHTRNSSLTDPVLLGGAVAGLGAAEAAGAVNTHLNHHQQQSQQQHVVGGAGWLPAMGTGSGGELPGVGGGGLSLQDPSGTFQQPMQRSRLVSTDGNLVRHLDATGSQQQLFLGGGAPLGGVQLPSTSSNVQGASPFNMSLAGKAPSPSPTAMSGYGETGVLQQLQQPVVGAGTTFLGGTARYSQAGGTGAGGIRFSASGNNGAMQQQQQQLDALYTLNYGAPQPQQHQVTLGALGGTGSSSQHHHLIMQQQQQLLQPQPQLEVQYQHAGVAYGAPQPPPPPQQQHYAIQPQFTWNQQM